MRRPLKQTLGATLAKRTLSKRILSKRILSKRILSKRILSGLLLSGLILFIFAGCGSNGSPAGSAAAETFPSKPITLVVPSNPGGNYDNFARCIAANGGQYFGVPLIIKNIPGGMFTIGMKQVIESEPDGYTLETSSESANVYGTKFVDAGFEVGDVQFIAGMTAIRHTFCINAQLPYQDIEELLAYVKENPGKVTMGTSSPIYECWLLALRDKGYEFTQVPFPTGAATSTAVAGGHVDCAIVGLAGAKPLHEAGTLRILFVGDNLSEIPGSHNIKDYPWIEEILSGINVGTAMVTGPKGIPEDRLKFLEDALHKTWEDPAFQSMAAQLGLDPLWYGTEDVAALMQEVDTTVGALTTKYNVEKVAQD